MGPPPLSLKRALLLSTFFALRVLAQNDDNNDGNNNLPAQTRDNNPPNNDAPTPTPVEPQPTPDETSSSAQEEQSSTEESSERETSSSSSPRPTLPPLSTPTSRDILTDMPTLSRTVNTEVPTYPPPQIPPTHHAPFMNHSTLPDGTVFIAVGAILGAFGLAVLAWRGIVACLLHRSVERAAMAQHAANNGRPLRGAAAADKNAASFPAPPAQFYKYIERESSASLAGGGLAGGSAGTRRSHRGPTPSATPSQTNLFFSPTAAGSSSGLGIGGAAASNRDSARYLPSGFYASAASPLSSPGGGHGHQSGNSISMSTLRPSSRGGRGGGGGGGAPLMGPSPPESPDVGPRVVSRNFSTSSINLNRPPSPGARAPSAYLDDLLDEHPEQFPPAAGGATGGSPSPHHNHGSGSQGRRY